MTTSKHTPGPWTVDKFSEFSIRCRQGTHVATAHTQVKGWKANARLMAAGPIMLQALEELIAEHEWGDDPEHNTYSKDTTGIMFARDAIKKATEPEAKQ